MVNEAVLTMLKKYQLNNVQDYENALKEIIQEIALLGLWRAKFFEHALFYGGSALRILFDLNRYSEDLDFSLLKPQADFKIDRYQNALVTELRGFGFDVIFEQKQKSLSAIDSAFLKANTMAHFIKVNAQVKTHADAKLQIKLEVDRDPPQGFTTQTKIQIFPIAYSVVTMTLPDLFAGKMHAILCRERIHNVKGRDFYDLVWYVRNSVPLRLSYLSTKMHQTKNLADDQKLTADQFRKIFTARINAVDFKMASADVLPFLRSQQERDELQFWSKDFFAATILSKMSFID